MYGNVRDYYLPKLDVRCRYLLADGKRAHQIREMLLETLFLLEKKDVKHVFDNDLAPVNRLLPGLIAMNFNILLVRELVREYTELTKT